MRAITLVWVVVLLALAVVEYLAIRDSARMDTLSEHWWWLRDRTAFRVVLFGGWSWLTWHFFLGRSGWYGVQDALAIAVGVAIALLWRPW